MVMLLPAATHRRPACRRALVADRKCKVKEEQVRLLRQDKLAITAADTTPEKLASSLQAILHSIPATVVGGIATVGRAVIQSEEKEGRASSFLPPAACSVQGCLLLVCQACVACAALFCLSGWGLPCHAAADLGALGPGSPHLGRGQNNDWKEQLSARMCEPLFHKMCVLLQGRCTS